MKQSLKFYKCSHCGNIAMKIEDKGVPIVCCGEEMGELTANSVDAAVEKHVPVVSVNGNAVEVSVGSVTHPMTDEHHIAWIIVETNQGYSVKYLNHTGEPKAVFALAEGDTFVAAYEYCNLHGLWKKEA